MAVAQEPAPHVDVENDDFVFDDGFPQPREHACTVLWVKGLGFLTTVWIVLFHTDRVGAFINAYIRGDDTNVHPYEDTLSLTQLIVEFALESAVFCYIPLLACLSFIVIQVCSASVCCYRALGRARCRRLVSFHRMMAIPLVFIIFKVGSESIAQMLAIQSNDYYLLSLLKHSDPDTSLLHAPSLIEAYLKTLVTFFFIIAAALNYCVFIKTLLSRLSQMSGPDLSGIERGSLGSRGSLPSCSTTTRVNGGVIGSSGAAEYAGATWPLPTLSAPLSQLWFGRQVHATRVFVWSQLLLAAIAALLIVTVASGSV
ncbi:hypothetical protein PFISCL1PPCAC_20183, partial [Pristionchus fissidentatus]